MRSNTFRIILIVLFCSFFNGANAASVTPPSGIVAWWPADEDATDIIGTNKGYLQNGGTIGAGEVSQAFQLDGVNDFLTFNTTPNLDFGTGNFTIELWVKFNTFDHDQVLLNRVGGFGVDAFLLEYDFTPPVPNSLRFRISNTGNANDMFVAVSLVTGHWYHIAAVRQGNTSSIYLDGALIGSQTAGNNIDTSSGTTLSGSATMGALAAGNGRFLNGSLDEPTIYNRALSTTEIQSIFAAGIDGKTKPDFSCPDDVFQTALNPIIAALQTQAANPAIPARGIAELNKEIAALKRAQALSAAGNISSALTSIQTAISSMDLVTRNGLNLLPQEIATAKAMQARVQSTIVDVTFYVGGSNARIVSANNFMSTGQTQLTANNAVGAATSFKSAHDQVLQAPPP